MKQFLAAVTLVLTSITSLDAATIVFEHSFDVETERSFTREQLFGGRYDVPQPGDMWTIPPFNFSLGIAQVLEIDIEGTVSITGQIHDLDGHSNVRFSAFVSILPLLGPPLEVTGGGSVVCTAAPCDIAADAPYYNSGWVIPNASNSGWEAPFWSLTEPPTITVPITFYGPDTFFTLRDPDGFDVQTPITLRTSLTGVARATYIYEPFAEPIPEPATITLLGTGLMTMLLKVRRRNKRIREL